MEKDVITAHGSMRHLYQKMNVDSDGIDIHICYNCGNRCAVNTKARIYKCKYCGDKADIKAVPSTWVSNLFMNESSAMLAKPIFELERYAYSEPEK